MRCDQFMGLPKEAMVFLQNNTESRVCPCCNRPLPVKFEVIGHYEGMFMSEYDLFRHQLAGGGYADEYLQASPWSSGPCFFIGLKVFDRNGKETKDCAWSDKDINDC